MLHVRSEYTHNYDGPRGSILRIHFLIANRHFSIVNIHFSIANRHFLIVNRHFLIVNRHFCFYVFGTSSLHNFETSALRIFNTSAFHITHISWWVIETLLPHLFNSGQQFMTKKSNLTNTPDARAATT